MKRIGLTGKMAMAFSLFGSTSPLTFSTKSVKHYGHNELILPKPYKKDNIITRNDLCLCGSGLKYKKCCLLK